MTMKEKVKAALKNYEFKSDGTDLNGLIAYAYYLGRCSAAKECCDNARKIFAEQKNRAEKCRYHEMAGKVQGGVSYIFHGDYDGWIHLFDDDDFLE